MNTLRLASSLLTISFLLLFVGCQSRQSAPPAPTNVEVAAVIQKDVPVYSEWVTTLDGYVNANIQPQVSGYLVKQNYQEGSPVHKDEVLFEIDQRPFQAV